MSVTPHTLIVGAAPVPHHEQAYHRIVNAAESVVAADGGLDVCLGAGRMPDIVIGDFDSVSVGVLESVRDAGATIVRFPIEKDESDLDLALSYARNQGVSCVHFTAVSTGRLDHTLAALGTLLRSADLAGRLEEPGLDGHALDALERPSLRLAARPGQVLSVFALDSTTRVSIAGVRYPLDNELLPVLSSLGLSNVALEVEQVVTVHVG
ncbi:MAG: thiamine diphosphokinase, partial [Coriobacteriia bacterium]|nr:thiamine diphosphokinase [Coriobacteriia bacterium]